MFRWSVFYPTYILNLFSIQFRILLECHQQGVLFASIRLYVHMSPHSQEYYPLTKAVVEIYARLWGV